MEFMANIGLMTDLVIGVATLAAMTYGFLAFLNRPRFQILVLSDHKNLDANKSGLKKLSLLDIEIEKKRRAQEISSTSTSSLAALRGTPVVAAAQDGIISLTVVIQNIGRSASGATTLTIMTVPDSVRIHDFAGEALTVEYFYTAADESHVPTYLKGNLAAPTVRERIKALGLASDYLELSGSYGGRVFEICELKLDAANLAPGQDKIIVVFHITCESRFTFSQNFAQVVKLAGS